MKKFAIFVGNGFTLDLLDLNGMEYHSSYPLQNFKNTKITYQNFIDWLPLVNEKLIQFPQNDYTKITDYVDLYEIGSKEAAQLRQFLALSYSLLQKEIDEYNFSTWKWTKWLQKNKNFLHGAISFNYDLVLERALKSAGISYSRSGTSEPKRKIPLLKPHGSIDFDINPRAINIPIHARWNTTTYLNDCGNLKITKKWEWDLPRTEPDIIPPASLNFHTHLGWLKELGKDFKLISSNLEAFIIVGNSYWHVDRPEIDFYLEQLPKSAIVYIANNEPDKDLVDKLEKLELTFETFGFDELPW